MTTPSAINAARRAQIMAERLHTKFLDAELAALDLPPAGVAAVAPLADSPAARVALAEYVMGVLARHGLAVKFQVVATHDAIEHGDAELAKLFGAQLVPDPTGGPGAKRWTLPAGTPRVQHAEPVARELATRLVAREALRAEGGSGE